MVETRRSKYARMKRAASTKAVIPPELIVQIFQYLPSTSLTRLSCILDDYPLYSKELQSDSFRHKHAINLMSQQGNQLILLQSTKGCDDLYVIDPSKTLLKNPYENPRYGFKQLFKDFLPYKTKDLSVCEIIGSCNGLVCLFFKFFHLPKELVKRGEYSGPDVARQVKWSNRLLLWNPYTGEHHGLPAPGGFEFKLRPGPRDRPTIFGFGYDVNNETYKVVLAEGTMTKFFDLSTNVWELASNSSIYNWKEFEIRHEMRNYDVYMAQFGHYLKGSVHWIVSNTTIVAIDLSTEVSTCLMLPHCCCSQDSYHHKLNMGVLKGCLSVACYRSQGKELVIWVMEEFGRDDSWTNMYTLKLFNKLGMNDVRPPLWMSPDEDTMMFLTNERLGCLNLEAKESTQLQVRYSGDPMLKYAVRGIVHVDTFETPKPIKLRVNNNDDKALTLN